MTDTRSLALDLAAPAIASTRSLYLSAFPAELRAAVLVEIAGAAAALARRTVLGSHVDTRALLIQVTYPADVRAVLGRGAWLPTMLRPIPTSILPVVTVPITHAGAGVTQLDLFAGPAAVGGDR